MPASLRRTIKVERLFKRLAAHHPASAAHSLRVGQIARVIATELGCSEEQCTLAYESGILHDIGKVGVELELLARSGPLSSDEYASVQNHADDGAAILSGDPALAPLAEVAAQHHERLDGTGYPLKLSGDQIGLLPRIVAVADTYDAITAKRDYSPAQPPEVAITELRACSPAAFDARVVEALASAVADGRVD
jgi:HD-GYP domain-containing protein (c-di-GMP phosphodiesterase class II)